MKIVLINDRVNLLNSQKDYFENLELEVVGTTSLEAFYRFITERPSDYEVVLIHFGITEEGKSLQDVIDLIHDRSEQTRILVFGGDYPKDANSAIKLGLDGYLDGNLLDTLWLIEEISKGYLLPDELSLRGISVNTPEGRMEIGNRGLSKEKY